jgi:hypothetical protein
VQRCAIGVAPLECHDGIGGLVVLSGVIDEPVGTLTHSRVIAVDGKPNHAPDQEGSTARWPTVRVRHRRGGSQHPPPSAPRSGTASAHDDRLRYPIMTRKNNFNPGVNS